MHGIPEIKDGHQSKKTASIGVSNFETINMELIHCLRQRVIGEIEPQWRERLVWNRQSLRNERKNIPRILWRSAITPPNANAADLLSNRSDTYLSTIPNLSQTIGTGACCIDSEKWQFEKRELEESARGRRNGLSSV